MVLSSTSSLTVVFPVVILSIMGSFSVYDAFFITLIIAVSTIWKLKYPFARNVPELFTETRAPSVALQALATGVHPNLAWLRVRHRHVRWMDVPWSIHNKERMPLVSSAVQRIYNENNVKLPDNADLFYIVMDYPELQHGYDGPVMAFSNTQPGIRNIIAVPDCYTEGWPDARIGSVFDLHAVVTKAPSFQQRVSTVFWIGAVHTHPVRVQMMNAVQHIEGFQFVAMTWDPVKGPQPFVHLHDHCKYKFLVDMPGTGWSGRLKHLLCLGSVVFVFQRRFHEYWMSEFVPNVHYISIKEDGSDLVEKVNYLKSNPDIATSIALACAQQSRIVFSKVRMDKYYANVITEYVTKNGVLPG